MVRDWCPEPASRHREYPRGTWRMTTQRGAACPPPRIAPVEVEIERTKSAANRAHDFTIDEIFGWMDDWHARTGKWPTRNRADSRHAGRHLGNGGVRT